MSTPRLITRAQTKLTRLFQQGTDAITHGSKPGRRHGVSVRPPRWATVTATATSRVAPLQLLPTFLCCLASSVRTLVLARCTAMGWTHTSMCDPSSVDLISRSSLSSLQPLAHDPAFIFFFKKKKLVHPMLSPDSSIWHSIGMQPCGKT